VQGFVVPRMKEIIRDTVKATYKKLDSSRRQHSFELFGYDFMIDENWGVWLIEVNTNPCLELSSPYLSRIIPDLIENTLKLTIDCLFPEPTLKKKRATSSVFLDTSSENKYELIFHDLVDGPKVELSLGSNAYILDDEHVELQDSSDEDELPDENNS
jgi:hypothetical protein